MIGPGKYDDIATVARELTKAKGIVVIVFGGDKGEGFSIQADLATTLAMPKVLRVIADQIEPDIPLHGGFTDGREFGP